MKKRHLFSSISFRLLVFNLLIVFFPVAAFLLLNTYEEQLLKLLEHALVQQGRIVAAAMGGQESVEAGGVLDGEEAQNFLRRLRQAHEARIRIVDREGRVLADSSVLFPKGDEANRGANTSAASAGDAETEAAGPEGEGWIDEPPEDTPRENFLYRAASFPVRFARRYLLPPPEPIESGDFYRGASILDGEEVRAALEGRYGAATRLSTGGQISVNLYSALPVWKGDTVIGAVLVSQSTYRILQDLYALRLDIFKIFLFSLGAAVLLSIFLSMTISRPLKKLNRQARVIFTAEGRFKGAFGIRNRRDEIGKLAHALNTLADRLRKHIGFIEAFAGDVSHELKNPLASVRSAAEVASETDSVEDTRAFLEIIQRETARMESLISSIREISKIDTSLQDEETEIVDARAVVRQVIEAVSPRAAGKDVGICLAGDAPGGGAASVPVENGDRTGHTGPAESRAAAKDSAAVRISPGRLTQVLENILDNAVSFSPPGGRVTVSVSRLKEKVRIEVADHGPGIPEEILEKIFLRFFTCRDGKYTGSGEHHAGLGLAICKAIVEGYGGRIFADREGERSAGTGNGARRRKGACITVELPFS